MVAMPAYAWSADLRHCPTKSGSGRNGVALGRSCSQTEASNLIWKTLSGLPGLVENGGTSAPLRAPKSRRPSLLLYHPEIPLVHLQSRAIISASSLLAMTRNVLVLVSEHLDSRRH